MPQKWILFILEIMEPGLQTIEHSVFLIEIEKIKANPFQPRREFDDGELRGLSDSIRQYGVLQPLVVVRKEQENESGTSVEYELIAGERRLRASKLAGLKQVPVIIRQEPPDQVKLELALIENIQRKDLNAVERARAFKQLMDDFSLKHTAIGNLVGKSREWVSNTIRLLALPEDMLQALAEGKISEGHSRPLLMLASRPEEQRKMFYDMLYRNMNVREAELTARRIATERARNRATIPDPDTRVLESRLAEVLGTRVIIERKGMGGRLSIEFFSEDDLRKLFSYMHYRPNAPQPLLARTSGTEGPAFPADEEPKDISRPLPENVLHTTPASPASSDEQFSSPLPTPDSFALPQAQERPSPFLPAFPSATPAPPESNSREFPTETLAEVPPSVLLSNADELPPSLRLDPDDAERSSEEEIKHFTI